MKILHVSAARNWGGGENHIENLCHELSSDDDVQNFVLCVKNAAFHERLQSSPIAFFTAPMANKMDLRYVVKLGKICKKEKIDLIHIHDTTAITLTVMADYLFNLPPFILSKKTSFPIKNRKQTLFKYNYPKIKKILCASHATKKIAGSGIVDQDKILSIYHGTSLETKSDKTPFLIREKLKLPSESVIIGNIANHIRAKSLETMVEVANYLVNIKKEKDFHFVQIGSFTDRSNNLKTLVKTYGLAKNFHFFGHLENASNFIPQFSTCLMTSQSEGLPQVIYESFYHKIPVISTNVGGIPEAITHNENGLLSNAHDHKKLAEHILSLHNNEMLKKDFTERSYEKLVKNFTTKTMAEKTMAEYKKVLNGKY